MPRHGPVEPSAPHVDANRLRFLAFQMLTPGTAGTWRDPTSRREYLSLEYWQEQAVLLERAGFEGLFFADLLGAMETKESGPELAIRDASSMPLADPFTLVSALAAVTRRLGFVVTASTEFEHPFALARRFSSLDHFTNGRIGWNIVTSYLESAADNFGVATFPSPAERYARAEEFLAVTRKLWSSWEPDAVVKDAERGSYADPRKVHAINHRGPRFTVKGPHLLEPSPQREPVRFVATMSEEGLAFAARHAEGVYTRATSPQQLEQRIDRLRSLSREAGRDHPPAVYALIDLYVGSTEDCARRKAAGRNRFATDESLLLAKGIDIRAHSRDARLASSSGFGRSRGEQAPTGKALVAEPTPTIGDLLRASRGVDASSAFTLVGTPEQVTDRLLRLAEHTGLTGFVLPSSDVSTYADFARLLTPHLRSRGLLDDPEGPARTMRERFGFPAAEGLSIPDFSQSGCRHHVTNQEKLK